MDTREFLEELFGEKPPKSYIAIWTLDLQKGMNDPKRNHTSWFTDLDEADDYIQSLKNKPLDVYFSCGLQAKDLGPKRRGEKKDIIGITGFWADIDIGNKAHKKHNYPPATIDAISLVNGHGYDPNIIIHSGHGIHCWWLFKQPWIFSDKNDREKAERLSQRMQATILQRAKEHKWTIDSTWELTRVLRPPGTINHKHIPVDVELYENENLVKYEDPVTSFEQFLLDESEVQYMVNMPVTEKIKVANDVIIDSMAEPPADMLDMMCEADSEFKASWHHKRDDMNDTSPSGYAMSLATLAMTANWNDQEITNLIIAWYRRHGQDMNKACRRDFIGRTLEKARQNLDKEFISHYLNEIEPAQHTKYEAAVDPEHKKAKKFVRKTLNLDITYIKKYPQEEDSFYEVFVNWKKKSISVTFRKADHLTTQKTFRNRIFEVLDYMPLRLKPAIWEKVVKHFGLFMVIDDSKSPESGDIRKRVKAWIRDYLADKPVLKREDFKIDKEPFVYMKHWFIDKRKFHTWTWSQKGNISGDKKTELDLKIAGVKYHPVNVPDPSTKSGRGKIRPWKIPLEIVDPKNNPGSDIVNLQGYKNKKEGNMK